MATPKMKTKMKMKTKKPTFRSASFQEVFASDELLAEILLRTTGKTLFRAKCVCKRWQALMSEESFTKNLVSRSKSLSPSIDGFIYNDYVTNEMNFFDFKSQVCSADINLSFLRQPVNLVACHGGLILCYATEPQDRFYPRYFVCNPYNKQWVVLPEQPNIWLMYIRHILLVSYYKNEKIEYKVVCFKKDNHNVIDIETYCSETGEWRASEISHTLGIFRVSCTYILPKGSIYLWDGYSRHLCLYDWREEIICSVDMPTTPNSRRTLLGVSAGCLSYAETSSSTFRVWILVDGVQWSLKHNIKCKSLIDEFVGLADCGVRPFALHPLRPDHVFLRFQCEGELEMKVFLYQMDTRRIEVIDGFYPHFDSLFPYSLPAWNAFLRNIYYLERDLHNLSNARGAIFISPRWVKTGKWWIKGW